MSKIFFSFAHFCICFAANSVDAFHNFTNSQITIEKPPRFRFGIFVSISSFFSRHFCNPGAFELTSPLPTFHIPTTIENCIFLSQIKLEEVIDPQLLIKKPEKQNSLLSFNKITVKQL